ncbi:pimeloyl-ACP methyl ester carboxylesterase [Skermanella aerolata]|uniref:esterase/lipase family protein n=1 Tax=Skermanella aerolata TaxID=393310 RepID=UPI003D2079C0
MTWPIFRYSVKGTILLAGVLLAIGCAGPISVERVDHATVHQELTRNVLSAHTLSDQTRNVLRQRSLTDLYQERPEYAVADLHTAVVEGQGGANEVFALAEMSFLHAEERGGRPYYLASALYAYAFLFPGTASQPPDPYDPRLRLASDMYNRGLTSGLATEEGDEIAIRPASYQLPFGQLDVAFDPRDLAWGGRQLTGFFPAAELEISGLDNRYRQSGIGAPLAAGTTQGQLAKGFQVAVRVKTPVTALLRIDDPWRQLGGGIVRGQLELHPSSDVKTILIDQRQVPLEVEYTASLAYMLSGVPAWEFEYGGFLRGNLLDKNVPSRLVALEPYQSGRIPVVFVHGTASSPVRWAEMLNDLRGDPRIRDHFQFWFFSYETGNPVPYSAMLLRDALREAVAALDPSGEDPSLHEMVVIGHSQGGLLTKMAAIDVGDRLWNSAFKKPPEELDVSPQSREILKQALFIKPVPSVRRLIFIATPHGGSYVAGDRISHFVASLVRLPGNLLRATSEISKLDRESTVLVGQPGFGSIYAMTPGSLLVRTLARTPIVKGVKAHSIIAVRGDGPAETGDDGVVEYKSAHIQGVDSEFVVRSGHSTQSDPHTIEEVRRILLLHWAESCTKSRNCGLMPDSPSMMASKTR